jgi:DNA-binding transcriptional LysR family regulator
VRGDENYRLDMKHRLRVNDAKALLIATLNGFGIAFIAEDLAREGLHSGRLVKVLPDYETPSRPIHLIYHPDRRQTPKLKSFISAVIGELGK